MSSLSSGRTTACTASLCSGGASTIYLANANEVSSVTTNASGAATAITMTSSAANFYEFQFRDFSGQFTETVTVDPDTKNVSVEQNFEMVWNCRNMTDRNSIMDMAKNGCGMVAVHVEHTGVYWIWGHVEVGTKKLPVYLGTNEGQSGAAITDSNQETITLTCRTTEKAVQLADGATVMAALV